METQSGSSSSLPSAITVSTEEMTGGCFCGHIQYAIASGSEVRSGFCSCKTCQKLHSAPTTCWFGLKTEKVSLTVGGASFDSVMSPNASVRLFRASNRATRLGCAICGAPIFFQVDGADWIDVTLCSLNMPWADTLIPAEHMWNREKPSWFETTDSAPRYDTEPDIGSEAAAG